MRYAIVLPIDDMPVGATWRAGEQTPFLHCTLLPWSNNMTPLFVSAMTEVLARDVKNGDLCLESAYQTCFSGKVVHVLAENSYLRALHEETLRIMRSCGRGTLAVPPQFIGSDYTPHVSDCAGRTFPPRTTHVPSSLTLLTREDTDHSDKKVIGCYPFRS